MLGLMQVNMVDFGYWGDIALDAWVNINPSPQWANRVVENFRGLPFGAYLHSSRPARQRRLTGPLDNSGGSIWRKMQAYSSLEPEQRSDEQTQCGFLSVLPIDIRLIIYEMVLGGNVLHLSAMLQKGRIVHYVCPFPNTINKLGQHICSESSVRPSSASPRDLYESATGFLPLLVTCRRIYSEAISTLYSANTFEFTQNSAAFTFLKLMIPPQRLPILRHFRLHLRIPRHPALNSRALRDWNDLWDLFAGETSGLQSFYLDLQMLQPVEAFIESTRDDEAEDWIRPIVSMALKSNARRECKVELVTRRVKHEPAQMFKDMARRHADQTSDEILRMTCTALHERIRISLGGSG